MTPSDRVIVGKTMETMIAKGYEFKQGNLMLFPYIPKAGPLKEESLAILYNKLHEEDLWDIVFHEDPSISLLNFMNFFSDGKALLQVLTLTYDDKVVDSVGMSWVADISVCGGVLTRAIGSFVFFKDYQKPPYTDTFGAMVLKFWFEKLGLDLVVGVTPEPNRAAALYARRMGFKEVARLPGYTTYQGAVVTGIVTSMSKMEYHLLLGGNNGQKSQ